MEVEMEVVKRMADALALLKPPRNGHFIRVKVIMAQHVLAALNFGEVIMRLLATFRELLFSTILFYLQFYC